jgi:HlyD family secretion protein
VHGCFRRASAGSPYLEGDGRQYRLNSGTLVSAEIHLGTRTVMEYLLSTVSQTLHEAGREK